MIELHNYEMEICKHTYQQTYALLLISIVNVKAEKAKRDWGWALTDSFNMLVNSGVAAGQVIFHVCIYPLSTVADIGPLSS